MKSWIDIYKDRMNDVYRTHIRKRYEPFIHQILLEVNKTYDPTLVEIGCGAGNITRALAEHEPTRSYILLDSDEGMLDLADENTRSIHNRQLILGSLFEQKLESGCGYIIHSHGVLEHFSNDEIQEAIYAYKSLGPQIHYVPSHKYLIPSRGDERLLPPEVWHEICAPDEIIEFNDGYDLILKFNKR